MDFRFFSGVPGRIAMLRSYSANINGSRLVWHQRTDLAGRLQWHGDGLLA
jgi:hypothetical protein